MLEVCPPVVQLTCEYANNREVVIYKLLARPVCQQFIVSWSVVFYVLDIVD